MKRGPIGKYQVTTVGGEQIRAFVPFPLPPDPPLQWDGTLVRLLGDAAGSLGKLDEIANRLPDKNIFLYSYVRKEAVLSSQIEGTQSSLADLLLFELTDFPGLPADDVTEVSNYVAALEHGLARLGDGFPLSNRLIREMHYILLTSGRGSSMTPGEFRRSQNWIGGTRPGNAVYVPPPQGEVGDCMAQLEQFLHGEDDGLSPLVRAGLAHVQFETVHPFLDGNGRVGRLLITLLLCNAGVLQEPVLYLSLFLKQNRSQYYDLLGQVRATGDWETWLSFFLEGVHRTAEDSIATIGRLLERFELDRGWVQLNSGRRRNSALRVLDALMRRPITSIANVREQTQLSISAASSAMSLLNEADIAIEITGQRRNRVFVYANYLAILNEGLEPL